MPANYSPDPKTSILKNELEQPVSQFRDMADRQIWDTFKAGSKAALIFIYECYFDALYAYGHQFSRDSEMVKDCIQELFEEINESKKRLSHTNSIRHYLFKALKYKILKALKKQSKVLSEQSYQHGLSFDFEISVEQTIINRQLQEEKIQSLNNAIAHLTDRQKEVIFYFFYEGFDMEQIKQLMHFKSVKAAQNIVYRAIKQLRGLLISCLMASFSFLI